jgi:hypothetical protein
VVTRTLPDDDTILADGAHAMERNTGDDSVLIVNQEAAGSRVHADRRERDDSFLVGNAVVVAKREPSLAE